MEIVGLSSLRSPIFAAPGALRSEPVPGRISPTSWQAEMNAFAQAQRERLAAFHAGSPQPPTSFQQIMSAFQRA